MRSVRPWLRLIRWPNALIAAAGVFVGSWYVVGMPTRGQLVRTTCAALAAIALTAFANAFNDWVDVDIDRVAHPERPLPSGELSEKEVSDAIFWMGVAAVLFSTLAQLWLGFLTYPVLALMLFYSGKAKPSGWPGNVIVALLASLPFAYGAAAAGHVQPALPLVLLAMPLHFAREVTKDLDDAEADRGVRRTLPVAFGVRVALGAIVAAVALFFALLVSLGFTTLAFLPAVLLVVAAVVTAFRVPRSASLLFKSSMVAAMAALVATRAL